MQITNWMFSETRPRLAIASAFIIGMVLSSSARAEPMYLEAGIGNFNLGQFAASLYEFQRAANAKPQDPTPHYYMGSALSKLNQHEESYEEFKKAYMLAPATSPMKAMAKTGMDAAAQAVNLDALAKKVIRAKAAEVQSPKAPTPPAKAAQTKPLDADEALLQATGGIPPNPVTQKLEAERASGANPMRQSAKTAPEKANRHEQGAIDAGGNDYKAAIAAAEAHCKDIQQRARTTISDMRSKMITTGDKKIPVYSEADYADLQRHADEECATTMRQAKTMNAAR